MGESASIHLFAAEKPGHKSLREWFAKTDVPGPHRLDRDQQINLRKAARCEASLATGTGVCGPSDGGK